ncbi:MAG: hypothetical protein WCG48_03625 [Candidatus Berkelbacteria bacterium]
MVHNPKNSQKVMAWCLEAAIGLIFKGAEYIGHKISSRNLNNYLSENSTYYDVSQKQINQMVYDLKRRNYISFGEGDSVVLTHKAKIKIIDQVVSSKRRDGKYRFISFDIPESKRLQRDNFRLSIKRMGFRQVQKSLWVSDLNIGDLVESAITEYKVGDYVAYFVAEKSNIDKHIVEILKRQSDK